MMSLWPKRKPTPLTVVIHVNADTATVGTAYRIAAALAGHNADRADTELADRVGTAWAATTAAAIQQARIK